MWNRHLYDQSVDSTPTPGLFFWLLLGGLFYTFGVLFYACRKIPYHHAIWHIFVLLGSAAHFTGMLLHLTAL